MVRYQVCRATASGRSRLKRACRSLRPPVPGNPRDEEDERGLWESVKGIQSLVEDEVKAGIPEDRIVVGGFSQGAAISLLTGLTSERKVNF